MNYLLWVLLGIFNRMDLGVLPASVPLIVVHEFQVDFGLVRLVESRFILNETEHTKTYRPKV